MENTQEDAHSEENGHGNGNALKELASEKVREIREVARDQASERVRELTGKAQEQVEGQRERIASRVDQAAASLRDHAQEGENIRFEAERRVAHSLESAAGYLHSHHTNEVAGDVSGYVRQHPVRSMIIAGIIGYLLGKLLG